MKAIITIISVLFFSCASAQMTFHWRQIAGPKTALIANPDSATTLVKELYLPGKYEFEFSVTNAFGVGRDSVTITVLPATVLAITPDSTYHITRPEIKKLEIKAIARSGDIFIQIKSPKFQRIECALYDITGRKLAKIDMKINKGINFISIPKPRLNGIYLLRFISYFESVTKKIFI